MADAPRYRTLLETPEYRDQLESLAQIYSDEMLDKWLLGLLWGIATNPQKYEKVTWSIYQAKSRSFDDGPSFRIIFEMVDEDKVGLLWIEEVGSAEELTEL
jgi:hypothetical protein